MVSRKLCGIWIFLGCEVNILAPERHIDLEEKILQERDLVIARLFSSRTFPCFLPLLQAHGNPPHICYHLDAQ